MRILPDRQYLALQTKALEAGATGVLNGHIRWVVSGRCSNPYEISYQRSNTIIEGVIDLITPCRNCQHCLKVRARQWAARAGHEYARSEKTWMVTLEFAPYMRRTLYATIAGETNPQERAKRLVRATGVLSSLYLKRLRKAGATFRYMMVPELHKDGMVHWHMLYHGAATWRSLDTKWDHGFFHAKLIKPEEAAKSIRYVAKYLAKAKLGRVRSSIGYGKPPAGIASEGGVGIIASSFEENYGVEEQSWFKHVLLMLGDAGIILDA